MKRLTVLEYLAEKGVIEMGYRICPYCGAHLDPDEICDCIAEKNEEKENSTHETLASSGAIKQ